METDLYGTISRYNLKAQFTEDYCRAQGLDPAALTEAQAAALEAAWSAHRDALLAQHRDEIQYGAGERDWDENPKEAPGFVAEAD